jgi:hypothetical protein
MQFNNIQQSLSLIDFPLVGSVFPENSFFDGKDDLRDGNMLNTFDNTPFDMVYSTPPSSPEKGIKIESPRDMNNVQVINFPTVAKNDNMDSHLSLNQFVPLTSIPISSSIVSSNEPYITTMLNNGPILIPRTSIIAVDPVVYVQLLQQTYRSNNLFNDLYPQINSQLLYQLSGQQITTEQVQTTDNIVNETINPKKRKSSSNKRPQRRVRPKVVPEKGAIQCIGMNRKKNQRCRNAALMEYIGPRPKYCAEHIHLDPDCLYMKCGSTYQKVPGDKKGCREVVLKEFGLCHKHYRDTTEKMVGVEGYKLALEKLERVNSLLNKLESEAMKAKKTNADLYQRKNKLIPKFQDMKTILILNINKLKLEGFGEESTK